MSRDELSLLLYLETRVVDHGGSVDALRMSKDDFSKAAQWNAEGYLQFGRIYSKSIQALAGHTGESAARVTHWVKLSERAWVDVAVERRARAERTFARYFEPNMPREQTS